MNTDDPECDGFIAGILVTVGLIALIQIIGGLIIYISEL